MSCNSAVTGPLTAAALFVAALCPLSLNPACTAAERQDHRPNIIVILSDDMGFSDIGCYGGEIRTPVLDSLAANGVRMTQFYNTARCCPTRACLLTGLYPHQAGVGHMMEDRGLPQYRGNLNDSCRTIAEVLRPAGYRTWAVGKWHVTRHIDAEGPKYNWPLQRGFQRFYGTIHGAGSFWDPSSLVRDNNMISAYADPEYKPERYYYTDAISDHAVRFIDEHKAAGSPEPFFMYVAYTAAHWPMHAFPEDIEKYRGKYDAGYGPTRAARFRRAAELGLIDPEQPMSAQAEDWDAVPDKRWEAAGMEVYAAMVDRMDQGIGRIMGALRTTEQFENTLVLFMQDNGGCAETLGRRGNDKHPDIERPEAPAFPPMQATDFATRGIVPDQTRDGYPVRMGRKVMPGPEDTYIAYGRGWANVSNTPFREYKHWVHEGGISTPLIAHWPAGISGRGELRHTPGHLIDIAATCRELAEADYPEQATPLQGVSLMPVFADDTLDDRMIFWEHEGNRAIRSGDLKLVSKHRQDWQLYDISKDRTEQNNLSEQLPQERQRLQQAWQRWSEEIGVAPWPLPKPVK